jgi:Ca2+-binding EF-hand superfamily protein|tara:strand:+ start:1499 stop:1606 length:108 start_codon:yes stop_codon:yes gene_type:complete
VATKEAIAKALREIDENGDGEIDFEEFKLMMKKCN